MSKATSNIKPNKELNYYLKLNKFYIRHMQQVFFLQKSYQLSLVCLLSHLLDLFNLFFSLQLLNTSYIIKDEDFAFLVL